MPWTTEVLSSFVKVWLYSIGPMYCIRVSRNITATCWKWPRPGDGGIQDIRGQTKNAIQQSRALWRAWGGFSILTRGRNYPFVSRIWDFTEGVGGLPQIALESWCGVKRPCGILKCTNEKCNWTCIGETRWWKSSQRDWMGKKLNQCPQRNFRYWKGGNVFHQRAPSWRLVWAGSRFITSRHMCVVKAEFKTYTVNLRKINHIKQAQIENITPEISQEIGPNLASLFMYLSLLFVA